MDLRFVVTPYCVGVPQPNIFAFWRWGFDVRLFGRGVEAFLVKTHSQASEAVDEGRRDYRVVRVGRIL